MLSRKTLDDECYRASVPRTSNTLSTGTRSRYFVKMKKNKSTAVTRLSETGQISLECSNYKKNVWGQNHGIC